MKKEKHMKDYNVECDYGEITDAGAIIDRSAVVTVRASSELEAVFKAREVIPCSLVWRIKKG